MKDNTVYLDTETTGLNPPVDKVVEISIIDSEGKVLMNTLVNPERDIPQGAMDVHHITPEMVKDAPIMKDLEPYLIEILKGKRLVIYNLNYDIQFLTEKIISGINERYCCMKIFASFKNDWNAYQNDYRWYSLDVAMKTINYEWEGETHRALADTQATKVLWESMLSHFKSKTGKITCNKTCDKCGKTGLSWIKLEGWKLIDHNSILHICDPVMKEKMKIKKRSVVIQRSKYDLISDEIKRLCLKWKIPTPIINEVLTDDLCDITNPPNIRIKPVDNCEVKHHARHVLGHYLADLHLTEADLVADIIGKALA